MTQSDLEREIAERSESLFGGRFRSTWICVAPARRANRSRMRRSYSANQRDCTSGLWVASGLVEVRRVWGDRAEASASLHPLDGELDLPPERYSHELRCRAAVEAAKVRMRRPWRQWRATAARRFPNANSKSWLSTDFCRKRQKCHLRFVKRVSS